jgi:glycerol-3-phosphate dehydrogenase
VSAAGPTGGDYDLLVIGGGINGLGIAADAAARGLSVLLVEKDDFGGGTTAASSRLIHGGLRYLEHGEMGLVRESLRERGLLVRQRPHRIRPIELLIPAYRDRPPPAWKLRLGLRLYDLLARDPLFPSPVSLSRQATRRREPGLAVHGLQGGAAYPDAQVEFPERLCVELRGELLAAGGLAWNHTMAGRLLTRGGRVIGAALRDELAGGEWEVAAALTINAAGPWVDRVNHSLSPAGPMPTRLLGGTWGTHLVLPARPDGPHGPVYAAARQDARPFFLLPWDGRLLVGTTDVPFSGDPDHLRVEEWEVEYLLSETNRLFPGAGYRAADIQFTTIGVRPLPAAPARRALAAGAITRRHSLVDHERRDGIAGLASVVGGKLTTFRSLAEAVVDWCLRRLGRPAVACPTRRLAEAPSVEELAQAALAEGRSAGLTPVAAARLARIYGPGYRAILERTRADPALSLPIAPGSPALAAEVVHAVEQEGARTADDVARRRLMLLPPSVEALAAIRRIGRRSGID